MTFLCGSAIILFVPTRKEVNILGIHKGTRLTDTPKDRTLKVRFDAETERKLNAICDKAGKTKAQVIRDGIEIQFANMQR